MNQHVFDSAYTSDSVKKHNFQKLKITALQSCLLLLSAIVIIWFLTELLPQNLVPPIARDTGTLAVSVFVESLPFVIFGTLIATAVQIWVPQQFLLKLLPKNGYLKRAILSLFGVLLPVCECGNVPLSRGLLRRGLTAADSITFLLAAPLLNPVTILTTYQAFGFNDGILLARIIGGFIIANLIGAIFAKHHSQNRLLQPEFALTCNLQNQNHCTEKNSKPQLAQPANKTVFKTQVRQAAQLFSTDLVLLLPALTIGCVLAGIIQAATPQELLTQLGSHPVYSVLALLLLTFAISVCSTVDAFFMLAFVNVFMPGAIAAFLIFGAMIDIKMLLLLRTTFRGKTIALITSIAALTSLCIGLGVNLIA